MFKDARLEKLISLHHKVTVFVPATVGVNKTVDNAQQVDDTARLLSECFGGATSSPAVGYWNSGAVGLVKENTTVVFSYASETDLSHHLGSVLDWCAALRVSMQQENVALEIDGQMYFI